MEHVCARGKCPLCETELVPVVCDPATERDGYVVCQVGGHENMRAQIGCNLAPGTTLLLQVDGLNLSMPQQKAA